MSIPAVAQFLAGLRAGDSSSLRRLQAALVSHGGNVTLAAAHLGVTPRTLHRLRDWRGPDKIINTYAQGRARAAEGARAAKAAKGNMRCSSVGRPA